MTETFDEEAEGGVGEAAIFVIIAARLFGGAGVMDVAEDRNPASTGHEASSGNAAAE